MRKILISFMIAMITLGLMVSQVEAKRFGGGKSFGYNRSMSNAGASNASRAAAPAAKPASTGSKWLGPLAGLAMGGLLASLFMGHGLGTGILSWLIVAGVIFFAWRLLSRLRSNHQSMNNAAFQAQPGRIIPEAPSALHDVSAQTSYQNHSGFDEVTFLRQAKTTFIRLQSAYDHKNLSDIREFTTPQVFAEVQMQIQERGDQPNQTDVVTIDAELLDLDLTSQTMNASVRFSGLIRELQDQQPENIREIWHFVKDKFSQNWFVSGIQQEQ